MIARSRNDSWRIIFSKVCFSPFLRCFRREQVILNFVFVLFRLHTPSLCRFRKIVSSAMSSATRRWGAYDSGTYGFSNKTGESTPLLLPFTRRYITRKRQCALLCISSMPPDDDTPETTVQRPSKGLLFENGFFSYTSRFQRNVIPGKFLQHFQSTFHKVCDETSFCVRGRVSYEEFPI